MQITEISQADAHFPDILSEIPSPPKLLYALGELPKAPMIAIVGTRKLTPYAQTVTYQIAIELARAGYIIVSGLALGIDGIAHQADLDAGGKTVALLSLALDKIYPT